MWNRNVGELVSVQHVHKRERPSQVISKLYSNVVSPTAFSAQEGDSPGRSPEVKEWCINTADSEAERREWPTGLDVPLERCGRSFGALIGGPLRQVGVPQPAHWPSYAFLFPPVALPIPLSLFFHLSYTFQLSTLPYYNHHVLFFQVLHTWPSSCCIRRIH